jgi:hypothetical protein
MGEYVEICCGVAKLKALFATPQFVSEAQHVSEVIQLFPLWADSSNQPCLHTCS